jgi:hypothetical protein
MHALRPMAQPAGCQNLNHSRGSNAPVAHCPDCGRMLNATRASEGCGDDKHAAARRRQLAWCVDCGARLIVTFLK